MLCCPLATWPPPPLLPVPCPSHPLLPCAPLTACPLFPAPPACFPTLCSPVLHVPFSLPHNACACPYIVCHSNPCPCAWPLSSCSHLPSATSPSLPLCLCLIPAACQLLMPAPSSNSMHPSPTTSAALFCSDSKTISSSGGPSLAPLCPARKKQGQHLQAKLRCRG